MGPFQVDLRWLTLPVAAIAVFAVLSLLNGDDAPAPEPTSTAAAAKADKAPAHAEGRREGRKRERPGEGCRPGGRPARQPNRPSRSPCPPAGIASSPRPARPSPRSRPTGPRTRRFGSRTTRKLDFAAFEASSLQQLETLAGSARVVERNVGPSVQASSITLAPKNVPAGSPTYEVVLRGSGDHWYYLATTHQPSAPADAVAGVDLIQGSFLPVGGKG